ncbi:SurA N-terminal domain-containing protein [Dyella sp.]|uniref:SurA N-terminal domain-containing protein n=1 Tax=Dyella sp. TaxID=1869338 RepID=UPI002D7744F7|nr:SurA N-terminal domain-containing protein [Dyella sp.]HET6433512.1 SurA N-terminal domain-containing protein [Dyella sp.]
MLQALRNKMHGWPSIVILGIAVFAMSFFGIESYFMSRNDTFVAKVGKQEISQQQFQERMNQLRQRAVAEQGDSFDGSVFEQPATKLAILDQLVDEKVLAKANDDLGVQVSDQQVRDFIASIPAFELDGRFDPTTYRTVLAAQGKTPAMFESEIRASLEPGIIPDAITASTIITPADVDRYINLRLQRRSVRYAQLPLPKLEDETVTEQQIASYYKQHQDAFISPEQVSLQYVEVNGSDLKSSETPSDEELRKRYADEKQRFIQPEQRLVSHILIDVPKNASPEQQKAALAKAQKIAAEAKPDNFAALAKADSEDLGSRRQGGDLGWLEKGVTNAAFDQALFALQKGQISKPVLSDEGYHVIWLRDVRSGQAKPFEEVRDELAKEAQAGSRDRAFNELAGKLTDKTYQNPASLEPAAQELGLKIKTTDLFSRAGGADIASDPKVLKAAFSDDVLAQGNNSNLIELGTDRAVVVRVDKHVPAAAKPLSEVKDTVRQRVLAERTTEAAKAQAQALVARLLKGEAFDAVAASAGAKVEAAPEVVRSQPGLPPSIGERAFLMPHPQEGKPVFGTVEMADGSYALVALDKVEGADMSKIAAADRATLQAQMAKAYGTEAAHEFIDQVKARTEIKVAKDRL